MLLSRMYSIVQVPVSTDLPRVIREQGADSFFQTEILPAGAFVGHEHCWPRRGIVELLHERGIRVVTVLRHPVDCFYSEFFYIQKWGAGEVPDWFAPAYGKPLDSDEVLELMRVRLDYLVRQALEWNRQEKALHVRYEDLHTDAAVELRRLSAGLGPVEEGAPERAAELCSFDNMRAMSPGLRKLCRRGRAGQWRKYTDERRMGVVHEYAEAIRELGYEVED